MKQPENDRVVTLDRPPPLKPSRSVAVAVVACIALASAIYYFFAAG